MILKEVHTQIAAKGLESSTPLSSDAVRFTQVRWTEDES